MTIDVYGIGNALVDYEFEVQDSTLTRLQLNKGTMTLIDAQQERFLLEELDGIKHVKTCGGSAANSLITVQQLGAQGYYCCKVAKDAAGDFFRQSMLDTGLYSNMIDAEREVGETGKCLALITPDAQRTMHTFLGITAELGLADFTAAAIQRSRFVYLEGYLVASPSARPVLDAAIREAKAAGAQIAFGIADVNMVNFAKPALEHVLLQGVDILFANQDEAFAYCQTDDLTRAAKQLSEYAKQVVITRHEHGAMTFFQGQCISQAAYPVPVIDTLGAGDVFAGAYLYALAKTHSIAQALDIACFAAAQVVSQFGARLSGDQIKIVKNHIVNL